MADAFEHFKLAPGLANPGGARFGTGRMGDGVDANPALDTGHAHVLALPVLVTLALGDQLDELVVADLAVFVGGPDARFCQAAGDGSGLLAIDGLNSVAVNAVDQGMNNAVVI